MLIGVAGAGLVLWLAARRPRVGLGIGGLAGLIGLVLVAGESHAAAYASPAPAVAIVVHLLAVSVWLGGLLMLAWFAVVGAPVDQPLSVLVPRFSALALVAVALIVLTGAYSDWIEVRALPSFDDPYSATLILVKVALALGAFFLGASNYLSGGRETDRRFRPRVVLESGSPSVSSSRPACSPAGPHRCRGDDRDRCSAVVCPSRFRSTGSRPRTGPPGPPDSSSHHRACPSTAPSSSSSNVDRAQANALELLAGAPPGTYAAGGGLLPPDSRWEARSVVLPRTARSCRALGSTSHSTGRGSPPVEPYHRSTPASPSPRSCCSAQLLGLAFTLGGGSLPRVDQRVGRLASIAGGLAATILGGFILLVGKGYESRAHHRHPGPRDRVLLFILTPAMRRRWPAFMVI